MCGESGKYHIQKCRGINFIHKLFTCGSFVLHSKQVVEKATNSNEDFLAETLFPAREEAEETYTLSQDYRKLFEGAINYTKNTVSETTESQHAQRVRWWSVLALLRSLSSSPAAAASTLRERAKVAETTNVEEADEVGKNSVFDIANLWKTFHRMLIIGTRTIHNCFPKNL